MADDWLEVSVEVAGIDAELVADLLRPHAPGGVAIEPALGRGPWENEPPTDGDAPALVKAYIPPGGSSRDLRRSLRIALRFAPLSQPPRWRRSRRLPAGRWRDSWKRFFRPRRVGQCLVVKPSWARYRPRGGETVIEIDPGLAFGGGQHPTTAMCLRALEEELVPGARVLDLGTGSGILAISAAKLGAARVLALDIDPLAVRAARENAQANGVAGVIEAREGTLEEGGPPPEEFHLVLANITGLTIERLAPAFARALAPGGALIASGFLEDALPGLRRAFRAAGLAVERELAEGVWRAIVARRQGEGA